MTWFKLKEFACPCCGAAPMQPEFLRKIDAAREAAGIPFVINSGHRCQPHNKAVGGAQNSSHVRGYAADIKAETSREKFLITAGLISAGFNRIGIYDKHIHVDCDPTKPSPILYLGYYK